MNPRKGWVVLRQTNLATELTVRHFFEVESYKIGWRFITELPKTVTTFIEGIAFNY